MAILGAAATGAIKVYVKAKRCAQAYEVALRVWRTFDCLQPDPVLLAPTGKLLVYIGLFPSRSLEADLAGADLFINFADFKKLQRPKASSRSELIKLANKIISDFASTNPDQKMIRNQFANLLQQAVPGASERECRRAWHKAAPPEWHRGGRRARYG